MGKEERSKSEEREKEYSDINGGQHIGNNYKNRGDVSKDGIEIELKFLSKGKGTLANISQNALTRQGIIIADDWSTFRRNKFNIERDKVLSKYLNIHKTIEKAGRYVKEHDPSCKRKVIQLAKEDRLEYIKYISQKEINKDRLAKFTILLIIGFHTEELISKYIDSTIERIKELRHGYQIIYIYKDGTQKIENIDSILERFKDPSKFTINFKKCKQQNITIEYDQVTILQIAFHWKNVFQGISTPCLNIFPEDLM